MLVPDVEQVRVWGPRPTYTSPPRSLGGAGLLEGRSLPPCSLLCGSSRRGLGVSSGPLIWGLINRSPYGTID